MTDNLVPLDYKARVPIDARYGIGIVGCGSIMTHASMPCYRKHHLRVVGCYDVAPQASAALAAKFGIPKVYSSLDELLSDGDVDIVDVAIQPRDQLHVVRQATTARKHLHCQKPLSDTFAEAVEIVRLAREAGVKLAVNQQMRWDQAVRSARNLIRDGWIGRPTDATIQANFFANLPGTVWADIPRYEILFHSIHYLDSLRFLFGEPQWVTSRHAGFPLAGTVAGETKTITILDYASGLQALVTVNMVNPAADSFFLYRFYGTEGSITGTLGLRRYPEGEPDTLEWSSLRRSEGLRFQAKFDETYLPDSFIGPMASLMDAIQRDGVPETDGEDNLRTLRIAEAAYLSAAEHRSVRPEEIAMPSPAPDGPAARESHTGGACS